MKLEHLSCHRCHKEGCLKQIHPAKEMPLFTFAGYISFPEDVGLAQCSECKAIFRVTPRILKGDDKRGLYFEEEYGYKT